jgi:RND family efflux transporter MFP subunit
MKKIFVILIISALFAACSSNNNDEDSIRGQIDDYKAQVKELNNKIKELEAQLPNNGANSNATKVRIMEVEMQPFSKYFTATGEIEAIREAYISPEVSGQITRISVKEGQKVKRGQLLGKLNTSLIEKNIQEVETQLELAKTFYEKQTELWEQGIGSERQYLETRNNYENLQNKLASLKEQYNMSILYSPIDGYVEDIILKQGELASPGMQLMQIVDLDNLHVSAMLSEAYLPILKKGEMVTVTFPSYPDLKMKSPITRVGNVLNKQNRTFKVEVTVENPNGMLKPNLLANIEINDYNSDASMIVPSMVIREDLKGSYLYVVENNGNQLISKKKYIETGKAYNGSTEVLSGISIGEQVIVDGYSNVSDGSFIEVVS